MPKQPLRSRAMKFALNRQTPFKTDDVVRAIYGLKTLSDMTTRRLHCHRKNAIRIIRMVRPELAALYGGEWYVYDRVTRKWRARALQKEPTE